MCGNRHSLHELKILLRCAQTYISIQSLIRKYITFVLKIGFIFLLKFDLCVGLQFFLLIVTKLNVNGCKDVDGFTSSFQTRITLKWGMEN